MGGVVMKSRTTNNAKRAGRAWKSLRPFVALAAVVVALAPSPASAQSGSVSTTDMGTNDDGSSMSTEGGFLLGAKVGGIMSFNGLDPFVRGGLELGWDFGGTSGSMAGLLDVSYTSPSASGSRQDDRLAYDDATGKYDWEIDQRELVFQPTFLYRFTGGRLVPFVGLGARIYLLQTLSRGTANGEKILQTEEQSMKFGAGLPFGAEYGLGPGAVMAEGLVEWAPLNHRITGKSNLLAASLQIGYRMIF